ncbi:DNA translocase FtsK 4TM domain-containing protein [Pannonibacter phragmitetus]|uniref:DNA translocase FtsK 4TM domain-containing protein n=1 Tax=Pannonibacter phragmitetus TaxID=121719 RepID=UPI003D2EE604
MAAALAASLATWSVNDPSLNHATGEPVRNALGTPGAIISDILMQSIGLATAVFLVPVVLWGWRLLSGKTMRIGFRRIMFWFVGTLLGAGAVAALPVPESWPLPTGLGGFAGDAMHYVPSLLTQNLTPGAATITGVLGLGLPAVFLLVAAGAWFGDMRERYQDQEEDVPPCRPAPPASRCAAERCRNSWTLMTTTRTSANRGSPPLWVLPRIGACRPSRPCSA